MSHRGGLATAALLRRHAPIFAALGDETRLSLLARLCERAPCSISQMAEGSPMTRQAITKHLRVLERAGLVRGQTAGRECLFEIESKPLEEVRDYLERVSQQWDEALARLKIFVEM
jgi:DNA-binding transcriptional ArsR family regulator